MHARIAAYCILPFLMSLTAQAQVRFDSAKNWKTARLISPGQQVWSFQSRYRDIRKQFSNDDAVTWHQVIDAEPNMQAKTILDDHMRAKGLDPSDVAATAQYDVNHKELNMGVNWAYGMTSRWMIGFEVPFVLRQTQVNRRMSLTSTLVKATTDAYRTAGLAGHTGVEESVGQLAEKHLIDSGYNRVSERENFWSVGDISLLNQFALIRNYQWGVSIQQVIRIPTARNPDVRNYLRTSNDEGNVDLGLTTMADYQIKNWILEARLGFVAQLPDRAMQVNPNGPSSLVGRDLGDWTWGSLDGEYHLDKNWDMSLQYSYFNKASDRYQGDSSSENTDQELHETRLGLLYSFGDTGARRGVDHKWVASLGYTYPLAVRNSIDVSQTSIELTSYF